jgi:hypothetical protein
LRRPLRSAMSRDKNRHLRLAGRPADYQKLVPVMYKRPHGDIAPIVIVITAARGTIFTGTVRVEKFESDVRVGVFDDLAIWELMYFGKARSPML